MEDMQGCIQASDFKREFPLNISENGGGGGGGGGGVCPLNRGQMLYNILSNVGGSAPTFEN